MLIYKTGLERYGLNVKKVIKILTDATRRKQHFHTPFIWKKKKKGGFDSTGSVISAELTGFEGGGDWAVCFHSFHPAISELTVLLQQAAKWKGMQ